MQMQPRSRRRRSSPRMRKPLSATTAASRTYRVLERLPNVLWLVTGADKAQVLPRLRADDRSIPAGRVSAQHAVAIADEAAAGGHA